MTSCSHNMSAAVLQGVPLRKLPVIVGEISAYDQGSNAADNTDTTRYSTYDKAWLGRTANYLKSLAASSNGGLSFFLWCWNANSRECVAAVEAVELQCTIWFQLFC